MAKARPNVTTAQHRQAVRRLVFRLVRREALADDLTQETFLRAQSSASTCRDRSAEQSWLYSIALNTVRDHFRAQGYGPHVIAEDDLVRQQPSNHSVEDVALQAEMSDCILEYLERVPSPQQEILVLHDMVGLKHKEISKTLDISEGNSRVLLHRARSLFRSILERNCVLTFEGDSIPCERPPPKGH